MSVDLLVRPDIEQLEKILTFARKLRIECIGIPVEILNQVSTAATKNMRIIPRCIFEIVKGKVKGRTYESTKCLPAYKPVDTPSARRIPIFRKRSIILFNKSNIRFFDESEARLLVESDCIAEISLRELLCVSKYSVDSINERIRYMRSMYRILSIISKYDVKAIFSSFAHSWWELWPRNSLISVLTKFGLSTDLIKRSIQLAKAIALEAM